MSLSIASIPGAEKCLEDIDKISAHQIDAFERFFVPVTIGSKHGKSRGSYYLCNMVFQGGGVLGLAHVGFLAGLERAGVRCAGAAGTSAGAIVATVFAAARKSELYAPMAPKLLELISTMPMASFIDAPALVRRLVVHLLNKRSVVAPTFWLAGISALVRLVTFRGLSPGDAFETWLTRTLTNLGIPEIADLERHLETIVRRLEEIGLPKRYVRVSRGTRFEKEHRPHELLKVVATGLPSGLKFTFPTDRVLLSPRYASASPALFVRASMAIPGFFEPKRMTLAHGPWLNAIEDRLGGFLAKRAALDLERVRELIFVDGGLLSNVQVDAFETMMCPPRRGRNGRFRTADSPQFPTVVATLVSWKGARPYQPRATWGGVLRDVLELGQAVRVQRDRDAWRRLEADGNQAVRLIEIDTTKFNWLNFTMTEGEMGALFVTGLNAARDFLDGLEG